MARDATGWPVYTDMLAPYLADVEGLPDQSDPQIRQETLAFLYKIASWATFGRLYQDRDYPDFWPIFNSVWNIGFPCPDDVYYMTAIDGRGVYRISGSRGTTRLVNFQIGISELMVYGEGTADFTEMPPPAAEYELDRDAHVRDDDSFDVILSEKRPEGYAGDWWPLDPRANHILVRQRAYDWVKEVDGRFAIERLDVPASKPRRDAGRIAHELAMTATWIENWVRMNAMVVPRLLLDKDMVNDVYVIPCPPGIIGQDYVMGLFDLGPDEALVLETDLPDEAHYWSFHLTDELTSTIDIMTRQTSLNGGVWSPNGYTARIDPDGRFRAVVSAADPGVHNWLDTGGHRRGIIVGRWWRCSNSPQPVVRKVKLDAVRGALPVDTPAISPEERDASLRMRRRGAQMRRRW